MPKIATPSACQSHAQAASDPCIATRRSAGCRQPSPGRQGLAGLMLALFGAVSLSAGWPGQVQAADLPSRKAGRWEQKVTSADPGMQADTVMQCTDAAAEKAFQQMGASMGQSLCSRNETRKDGASWVTESVCNMGPMKITSRAILTGDLNSAYRVETESKIEPPIAGKGSDKSVIEAKWVGACKAGQEPGDVIMSDGQKINVLKMGQSSPKRQTR